MDNTQLMTLSYILGILVVIGLILLGIFLKVSDTNERIKRK